MLIHLAKNEAKKYNELKPIGLFLSTDGNCICGCCAAIGCVFATMPLTGVVLRGWSSFEFHG